jgi:hypothetical protein
MGINYSRLRVGFIAAVPWPRCFFKYMYYDFQDNPNISHMLSFIEDGNFCFSAQV